MARPAAGCRCSNTVPCRRAPVSAWCSTGLTPQNTGRPCSRTSAARSGQAVSRLSLGCLQHLLRGPGLEYRPCAASGEVIFSGGPLSGPLTTGHPGRPNTSRQVGCLPDVFPPACTSAPAAHLLCGWCPASGQPRARAAGVMAGHLTLAPATPGCPTMETRERVAATVASTGLEQGR